MMQADLFSPDRYPSQPGWKRRDTSRAAAESMKGRAQTLRDAALAVIKQSAGLTADEVAAHLGESVLAIRPRVTELSAKGLIFDSRSRRQNASGKRAIVWLASQVKAA